MRPELTRGKYATGNASYKFPLTESPHAYTHITFYKYNRSINGNPQHTPVSNIQLPLPATVNDSTSLKISEFDMGYMKMVMDLAAKGGEINARTIKEAISSLADATTYSKAASSIKNIMKDPQKLSEILAAIPMFGDSNIFQAISGTIRNPHTTATFQGVVLKPFSFSWKLSPRSEDEAIALRNIKKHIENKILPSIGTTNSYALDYPHVVKVKFANTQGFPETNFAFVDSFQMDIPDMSLFKDGSPVVIQMTMSLKELDIRVSEDS